MDIQDDVIAFNDYKQVFLTATPNKMIYDHPEIFGKVRIRYSYCDALNSGENITVPISCLIDYYKADEEEKLL